MVTQAQNALRDEQRRGEQGHAREFGQGGKVCADWPEGGTCRQDLPDFLQCAARQHAVMLAGESQSLPQRDVPNHAQSAKQTDRADGNRDFLVAGVADRTGCDGCARSADARAKREREAQPA